ncbi:A disintegrin and metalloproteinase with thrombospondin motifs 20, partial [Xenoophorus captivus]
KQCKRLWCTSADGDHKGCRTQHMPLADGTDCGHGMVSYSKYIQHTIFNKQTTMYGL